MKRKIAAILASDVAGYSRLVAEDEEETLRRLKSYRDVFQAFISQHGGRVFNTAGDAVMVEFSSAVDAVRCAVDVQESLRTRNLAYPESRKLSFRMGITIGDVVDQDGDLLGDGVNIAARLETLAAPGGICISRSVYEAVSNKMSTAFVDLGPQTVKNIPSPVHAFQIGLGGPMHPPAQAVPVVPDKPGVSRLVATLGVALALLAGSAFAYFGYRVSAQRPATTELATIFNPPEIVTPARPPALAPAPAVSPTVPRPDPAPAVDRPPQTPRVEPQKPALRVLSSDFDGTWRIQLTGGPRCSVKTASWQITIAKGLITSGQLKAGQVFQDGSFRFSLPARVDPNIIVDYKGRLVGDSGSGDYEASACVGTIELKRA